MKPFDLEAAKRGDPVITEDGRHVRITCFDRKSDTSKLVALIDKENYECIEVFDIDGYNSISGIRLVMATIKRVGWFPIYKRGETYYPYSNICTTEQEANAAISNCCSGTTVARVEWEE